MKLPKLKPLLGGFLFMALFGLVGWPSTPITELVPTVGGHAMADPCDDGWGWDDCQPDEPPEPEEEPPVEEPPSDEVCMVVPGMHGDVYTCGTPIRDFRDCLVRLVVPITLLSTPFFGAGGYVAGLGTLACNAAYPA